MTFMKTFRPCSTPCHKLARDHNRYEWELVTLAEVLFPLLVSSSLSSVDHVVVARLIRLSWKKFRIIKNRKSRSSYMLNNIPQIWELRRRQSLMSTTILKLLFLESLSRRSDMRAVNKLGSNGTRAKSELAMWVKLLHHALCVRWSTRSNDLGIYIANDVIHNNCKKTFFHFF